MEGSAFNDIFDSFVYNDLRFFSDPSLQKRIWVDHEGPEVAEFEDDLGYFGEMIEGAGILFGEVKGLSKSRQKYIGEIRILYGMVEKFSHIVFYKHRNKEVAYFLTLPEWKEIVAFADKIYCRMKEEDPSIIEWGIS